MQHVVFIKGRPTSSINLSWTARGNSLSLASGQALLRIDHSVKTTFKFPFKISLYSWIWALIRGTGLCGLAEVNLTFSADSGVP
jgi:hypothetical protein